ncbi:conserved hypothetical protein [Lebetimonas natsushimae]|uniref:Uncharacterized protein n=1 Tax=Lebetimonas natsushimae TaxID=1936991 RepID=A0A292YBP7_9BACT|nr:glycosyltransferase [Lebetimonas natsushimae]GAX86870.1 conserved hypothetical protein [Lebetimonas natsushimae]
MKMNIIIYRNQLFKISESFITSQAEMLKKFNPIYVGRKSFGPAPKNSVVVTMDDLSIIKNINYVLFRNISFFEKNLLSFNPKLIHAHFGVDGIYAIKLAQEMKIPLITTFHGFDVSISNKNLLFSGKPAWINYLLYRKKLAKNGDLFICVSDFIRKKIIELGFPENKTITHYIGIDTNLKKNKIKKFPYKVILHVARLTEKKGTKYLIDAFKIINKEDKNTKLIIIGSGILEKKLKKQVKELQLENYVKFLGAMSHNEVMEWMQKADIFCLPSITAKTGDAEGLGMVFLEAGIYEVPVVATLHGGIPEVILNNKTGFLVEERNIKQLADKLLILLKNENLRKSMGKEARNFIKEKFDIQKQTKKLEEIYKGLI